MRAPGFTRRTVWMSGPANRVAVCIGKWNPMRSADATAPSSIGDFAVSAQDTAHPAALSHAAADATPKGWRPIS
jgi:hypothetical protein